MMDKTQNDGRGLADLLPWYETGQLAASEHRRVAEALRTDDALRRELNAVQDERGAAVAINEAIPGPSRQGVARFLAALDATSRRAPPRAGFDPVGWLVDRLGDLQPRTIAWGSLAASVVLVIQAAVIAAGLISAGRLSSSPSSQRGPSTYRTASSESAATAARAGDLLVAFVPTATAAGIQRFLDDNGLTIVGGPAAGYYDVRVARRDPSAGLDALIARLRRSGDIVRTIMPKSRAE